MLLINHVLRQRGTISSDLKETKTKTEVPEEMADSRSCEVIA